MSWDGRSEGKPSAGRGWAKVLPGVPAQGPKPLTALSPAQSTFLMKSRRTFWSSQLKVVKSS